jgi:energy-coupling factor transporter transmembrane protein EcfT
MDARAYGFKANRTSMVEYSFGRREAVFLLIVLWIVVLIFIF